MKKSDGEERKMDQWIVGLRDHRGKGQKWERGEGTFGRFQALFTNLPSSVSPLQAWCEYNGRADLENRIKELGDQFGIKRLCVDSFWGTEALHHLAIAAYNLCVLLQRRLGQLENCQLNTLRWRLFSRAAVWSRAQGKPTLKLAVAGLARKTLMKIALQLNRSG